MENEYLGEFNHDYGGGSSRAPSPMPSPPASPRQHDLPPVVPSQTHPLPRVPPALSPAHSHYGSLPQSTSTPALLAPPPPPPMGPRLPPYPSHPPLSSLIMLESSTKVVKEVDDERQNTSDLKRESVGLDSDEEVHNGVHANMVPGEHLRPRLYDAYVERMKQHLQESATSSFVQVRTHPPVEEQMHASMRYGAVLVSDHDKAIDGIIDPYWSGINPHFSTDTVFASSSQANLEKMLWEDALLDAQKVIIINPSSYLGYQLKHAALHGARRYDEAIKTFEIMLSRLDNAPEMQLRELRQQYLSLSEADNAIQKVIHAQLDDAPLRLLDTTSGLLCDREAQICAFKLSTEFKGLLSFVIKHADIRMERIKEVVAFHFRCVMLSHMWEEKEPLLHDIKDKVVYKLNPVGGIVKLQSFCKTARDAGYRWAWIDTCCIDQNNNVELQKSLNSMFIWYRHSALTIVYLADVPTLSKFGALTRSAWNTRGWTLPEFLAPKIVLFYQRDWTLYLNDRSCNHKESVTIMGELENATGINAQALVTFRPGMAGAREKLRWASTRVTTVQEDVAYSLFGIFGIHIPIIYGEKKQNALGRLLQEIVAQSGDITALDWVGKSSEFNSCLPADISSYKNPSCALPPLTEDDIRTSVSWLQNAVDIDVALKLYSQLDNLGAPHFTNRRLRLPCIAFSVTEVRRSRAQDQESYFAYEIKAYGLHDLLTTTEDKLTQFSRSKPTLQTFLLVRPWDPYLLELPDFADNPHGVDNWSVPGSMFRDTLSMFSSETGSINPQLHLRALRLIVHLGQPFNAFLLARQRGGEYKRIASDHNITAQVKDLAGSIHKMHVRTLEIL
ncbi:heterokaryon incompatibility protein-domain-containing protein [Suillus occidentalis]|nr:heterokaryon incompatibility protein-domain-containing protein [Suillus occidentalis]